MKPRGKSLFKAAGPTVGSTEHNPVRCFVRNVCNGQTVSFVNTIDDIPMLEIDSRHWNIYPRLFEVLQRRLYRSLLGTEPLFPHA